MGFSVVGATAVIGVSLLIALEILSGSLLPTVTHANDSYDDLINRAIQKAHTNINISSITTEINGSNYDHNITVENIGSITLKITDFNILINGTITTFSCSDTYLYPEATTILHIYDLPGAGAHKAKVVTENGITDYYSYTI